LWLRAHGRALSITDRVYHLRTMKLHYAGIHARLQRSLGKRGRRQDHRRALLRAGSFERWSEGPLHQLAHMIVAWCGQGRVATLVWSVAEDGTLPWDRLASLVTYKAQDAGIAVSQIVAAPEQDEALRNDDGSSAPKAGARSRKRERSQSATREGGE